MSNEYGPIRCDPGQTWKRPSAVEQVRQMRRDIRRFHQAHPNCAQTAGEPIVGFTWEALEQLLVMSTDCPKRREVARTLVSATRKLAHFKPPEMVEREILDITWTLMDASFDPFGDEADDMT